MFDFLIGKSLKEAENFFSEMGESFSVFKTGEQVGEDLVVKVGENNVIYVCGFLLEPKIGDSNE